MNQPLKQSFAPGQVSALPFSPPQVACWNEIGTYGKGSCPELAGHVHCRNCPVFSSAGLQLLSRPLPEEYRAEWTEHVAHKKPKRSSSQASAVLFRIALEWLAFPTHAFQEIAESRQIHSLPHHRRHGILVGLANVRGELLLCVSLGHILGLDKLPGLDALRRSYGRLLVLNWRGDRLAFPVDQVHGPCRFPTDDLKAPPSTLARSHPTQTIGILHWQQQTVGLLDPEALFSRLNGNLV